MSRGKERTGHTLPFGHIAYQRGVQAENTVCLAFTLLAQNNHLEWFKGYEISTDTENQHQGIDGWVITDVGKIPIQIKSSECGKLAALKKHPKVQAVVVICAGEPIEGIITRLVELVSRERDKYLALRQCQE